MIIVNISMHVIPEKQKELVQTLLSVTGSMEKEEGFLSHTLLRAIEDQNLLNLIVEWQSRKHLDHHLRSKIFGVLLGTKSLLSQPHAIHIYTIQRSEGMEAVNTARGQECKRALEAATI